MATITEDYCDFEAAKLLKEKGFNEECFALYNPNGILIQSGIRLNNIQVGRVKDSYSAPTQQMAIKWLREQNKIISILHSFITNKYKIIITQFNKLDIANLGNTLYSSNDYDYFSYEEACEAAIKYCLEHLI